MEVITNILIVTLLAVLTVMLGIFGYYGSLNPCDMLAKEMERDFIRDSSVHGSIAVLEKRLKAQVTVASLDDGQCVSALLRSTRDSYRVEDGNTRDWDEILNFKTENRR